MISEAEVYNFMLNSANKIVQKLCPNRPKHSHNYLGKLVTFDCRLKNLILIPKINVKSSFSKN